MAFLAASKFRLMPKFNGTGVCVGVGVSEGVTVGVDVGTGVSVGVGVAVGIKHVLFNTTLLTRPDELDCGSLMLTVIAPEYVPAGKHIVSNVASFWLASVLIT